MNNILVLHITISTPSPWFLNLKIRPQGFKLFSQKLWYIWLCFSSMFMILSQKIHPSNWLVPATSLLSLVTAIIEKTGYSEDMLSSVYSPEVWGESREICSCEHSSLTTEALLRCAQMEFLWLSAVKWQQQQSDSWMKSCCWCHCICSLCFC